jgi:uncharacterized protein (TIGR03067 family)
MKRCLACAFLLFASTALAAEPDDDLKAFQGTWVLADATLAGRDHIDDFPGMKLKVDGDKYEVGFGMILEKGTIKLDSAKKPKQIDLTTGKDGAFKGHTLPGIYELKDDTIVLCLEANKTDRPTKFEAPEKTRIMLFTFKREKK